MMVRHLFLGLALFASFGASGDEPVQGFDYALLQSTQPDDTPGKIEVIQFFSYGCPHCADLHGRVTAWTASLPADVVYTPVPVGFGRQAWVNLARTYYALEAIGDVEKVDTALFHAIHVERLPLSDERAIMDWLASQGVDTVKFADAFRSFGVATKVARADELARRYRITAVPTFTVDGRFAVIGRSEQQMLDTADALIVKAKSEVQSR